MCDLRLMVGGGRPYSLVPVFGQGTGVADTHRQVCLQLILNSLPVVFIVVDLVIACHVDVQQ